MLCCPVNTCVSVLSVIRHSAGREAKTPEGRKLTVTLNLCIFLGGGQSPCEYSCVSLQMDCGFVRSAL